MTVTDATSGAADGFADGRNEGAFVGVPLEAIEGAIVVEGLGVGLRVVGAAVWGLTVGRPGLTDGAAVEGLGVGALAGL